MIPFRSAVNRKNSPNHVAGRARCGKSLPRKTSGGRPYSGCDREAGGIGKVTPRALMLLVSPCYHWRNSPTKLRQSCLGHFPGTKGAASLRVEVRMTLRHVYADPRQVWGSPRPRLKTNAQNPPGTFSHKRGIWGSRGPAQSRLAISGRGSG